jgi:hypothetical protein
MSFNLKPKLVLKRLDIEKIFNLYESYTKNPEFYQFFVNVYDLETKCIHCKKDLDKSKKQYGIPISMNFKEDTLEFEVCGKYCSFFCSYKEFCKKEKDNTKKINIKYSDTRPLFRFLSYKFFGECDPIDKNVNLEDHKLTFIHVSESLIKN